MQESTVACAEVERPRGGFPAEHRAEAFRIGIPKSEHEAPGVLALDPPRPHPQRGFGQGRSGLSSSIRRTAL